MHPRARMFLHERERARTRGDAGVERCMNVELARMGYTNVPIPGETTEQPKLENTAQAAPGRPAKRQRRAKPRCEHGNPPDRCEECQEDPA